MINRVVCLFLYKQGMRIESNYFYSPNDYIIILMEKDPFNGLISIEEAADYANLSNRHVRLLLETGKIRGKKIGRDWITTQVEVEGYLKTNPKPGRKPKAT